MCGVVHQPWLLYRPKTWVGSYSRLLGQFTKKMYRNTPPINYVCVILPIWCNVSYCLFKRRQGTAVHYLAWPYLAPRSSTVITSSRHESICLCNSFATN